MVGSWFLYRNHYFTNPCLRKQQLKYKANKQIVSYFEEGGLVVVKKGSKYESNPMRTRLYPTPTFAAQLVNFYTKTVKTFEGDYRQF